MKSSSSVVPSSVLIAGLLLAASGCRRAPAPDAADALAPPPAAVEPAPNTSPADESPNAPTGAEIAYRCADGSTLVARYADHDVVLRWPDGRSATLPRAESASNGDGDVYVGATVSLLRDGPRIELHDGSAAAVICTASA